MNTRSIDRLPARPGRSAWSGVTRLGGLALLGLWLGPTGRVVAEPAPAAAMSAAGLTGWGADNPGGRGGAVLKVTTLAADGPGSFKAALATPGPRIIVFEVGGVIDWRMSEVDVTAGRLTIAGETAPSPGITLIRGTLEIMAPDVIVRHLRVRLGDGGDLKQPKHEADAMGASGPKARNILFDHCSTSWSIDENLSVSGPRVLHGTAGNVTIRHCIIAEALDHSTHPKGPHSKGTLIHDFVHHVALIGNFYAHNASRSPCYVKSNATVFLANNLIYDPGYAAAHLSYAPGEYKVIPFPMLPGELTAVGNVMRPGRSTLPGLKLFTMTPVKAPAGKARLYQADNRVYDLAGKIVADSAEPGGSAALCAPQITRVDRPMLWPEGFTPLPVADVEASIVKNAGARPRDRDAVDRRLFDDYRNRAGRIIDSQTEVGGYPAETPTFRHLEVPAAANAVEAWLDQYRRQVEF